MKGYDKDNVETSENEIRLEWLDVLLTCGGSFFSQMKTSFNFTEKYRLR